MTTTYQVHQSNVEEYSRSNSEDPAVCVLAGGPDGHAHKEPQDGRQGRDKVEGERRVPGHPRGEQDKVVAHLVRHLMEDDGDGGADAQREALGDGRTQGNAIGKVVDAVSDHDEPGQRLDTEQVATEPPAIVLQGERDIAVTSTGKPPNRGHFRTSFVLCWEVVSFSEGP